MGACQSVGVWGWFTLLRADKLAVQRWHPVGRACVSVLLEEEEAKEATATRHWSGDAMEFDQKPKDLLRLQTTRPDAFIAELDEPWPGMQSDIELALGILVEYQRRGKPLRLIEDFQINEETGEVSVLMPEWQTSILWIGAEAWAMSWGSLNY
jgi:hypothetical protein